jgi:peroxisomal trans-2-enoyl-CoA reductase
MRNGFPGMSHTGAARAGVENMTKTLAVEWAANRIRVNCVAPGVIFNESADKHYKTATGVPDMLQSAVPSIPARRLGTVEEVASAVVFLLSPGAAYISGISLAVDGASHLTPSTRFVHDHEGWPQYRGWGGKL